MSKKDKEVKQMEKILKPIRDDKAMELFNKHEYELNPLELKELDDWMAPRWKEIETLKGHIVLVNQVGQIMDPKINKLYTIYQPEKGYPFFWVNTKDQKDRYCETVHRLVAQAFVPNDDPINKTEVNHIDGNKHHNWYRNLEWVTHKENQQHAVRNGLMHPRKGEESNLTKYTEDQVRKACQLLQDYSEMTYDDIGKACGITSFMVGCIYRGIAWKDISKNYKFPDDRTNMEIHHGEDNGNSVYTESQIKHVCQLLQDRPDLTFTDIARQTFTSVYLVGDIYHGTAWKHVSKDYNIPYRVTRSEGEKHGMAKCTVEQIEEVCKLLGDVYQGKLKMTHKQIANKVGVSKSAVDRVHSGDNWTHISSKYDWYKAKFGDKNK